MTKEEINQIKKSAKTLKKIIKNQEKYNYKIITTKVKPYRKVEIVKPYYTIF